MPRRPDRALERSERGKLTLEGIVEAAIVLADAEGIDGLSMRKLGTRLSVDPMSIYHHLRDKDALLAAMADRVVTTIGVQQDDDWATALRGTILGARAAMLRHPWTAAVIERLEQPTPAILVYLDAVLDILRRGGFSLALAHHSLHVLGSRILGFSEDLFDDSPDVRPDEATRAAQVAAWSGPLPRLAELAGAASHDGGLGGCDDDAEFAFALDLLLEGLERRRTSV